MTSVREENVEQVQKKYNPMLKKQKTMFYKKANLGARKATATLVRGGQIEVAFTGGLCVRKSGYITYKKEGFGQQYVKASMHFDSGVLKLFDPDACTGNARKRLFKRRKDLLGNLKPEDKAEEIIDVLQIKEIKYSKRNSDFFELIVRPNYSPRRSSKEGQEGHRSVLSRLSRMSRMFKTFSKNMEPKRSSLLPGSWAKEDKTYTFKFKVEGDTAEEWVQAILFELRNQASFTDETITTLSEAMVEGTRTASLNSDNNKLENLYRQAVDLWSLARGKISKETLATLTKFVKFLEGLNEEELKLQEIENWKLTIQLIEELLEEEQKLSTGLAELQQLNDFKSHLDDGKFVYTDKILNEKNNAFLRRKNTLRSKFNSFQTKTIRNAKGILGFPEDKRRRSFNLDDIELVRRDSKEVNKEAKEEQIERLFPSAMDVKMDRERKEDEMLMRQLTDQQNEAKKTQLEQLREEEAIRKTI